MKIVNMLLMVMMMALSAHSQDMVILKSGKRYLGSVTEKNDEIILRTSLGVIKYPKGAVEIVKNIEKQETTTEYKGESVATTVESLSSLGTMQIELNSGRKVRGEFYSLGGQYFLKEGPALVMINESVIKDSTEVGSKKVKGDIISGEKCFITLNSGRIFSGLVEEKEEGLMVTSSLGSVMISNKNLEKVVRTGELLDLNQTKKKVEVSLDVVASKTSVNTSEHSPADKRVTVYHDPNIVDQEELDRRIQKSLDRAKEKKKIITNSFDFY